MHEVEMRFAPKEWWQKWTEFWRETKAEMKKVAWPSRPEIVGTTGTVIVATIIFGIYLWICDLGFYRMIDTIFGWFASAS
jgi:preprotein translocase subunit SecE